MFVFYIDDSPQYKKPIGQKIQNLTKDLKFSDYSYKTLNIPKKCMKTGGELGLFYCFVRRR